MFIRLAPCRECQMLSNNKSADTNKHEYDYVQRSGFPILNPNLPWKVRRIKKFLKHTYRISSFIVLIISKYLNYKICILISLGCFNYRFHNDKRYFSFVFSSSPTFTIDEVLIFLSE